MSQCAYCKRRTVIEAFKPFCSKRCSDLDLGQWLTGGYAIPTEDSGLDQHSDPHESESDPYRPAND